MKRVAIVLLLAAALLQVFGCDKQTAAPAQASTAASTTASAPPPQKSPADTAYVASGPLLVEQQVDVVAQREGMVANIAVEVGDHVRKGQLLAGLDARQLQADRQAAQAKVRSTEYEFQHWQEETKVREADLARDEEMWRAQLITAKQVEHSRYSVTGAKYETQREGQNLVNAKETLRALELELEKTRIVAPFDGVVARRYVRVGQRLSPNDRVFWVTALAPLMVKFTVPQDYAGKLKRGLEVLVSPQGSPAQRQVGRVTLVSPVVDPASGALEVQAQIVGAPKALVPGMTVDIRVPRP